MAAMLDDDTRIIDGITWRRGRRGGWMRRSSAGNWYYATAPTTTSYPVGMDIDDEVEEEEHKQMVPMVPPLLQKHGVTSNQWFESSTLDLRGRGVGDDIAQIVSTFKGDTLMLSNNNITNRGAYFLAGWGRGGNKHLHLGNNRVGNLGAKYFNGYSRGMENA